MTPSLRMSGPHRPPSDPWHQFAVVAVCAAVLLAILLAVAP